VHFNVILLVIKKIFSMTTINSNNFHWSSKQSHLKSQFHQKVSWLPWKHVENCLKQVFITIFLHTMYDSIIRHSTAERDSPALHLMPTHYLCAHITCINQTHTHTQTASSSSNTRLNYIPTTYLSVSLRPSTPPLAAVTPVVTTTPPSA
jgi:hypothetical protein